MATAKDDRHPDIIYCLGDLVGYNIWPNEVVNEIRKRKIPTIAGNYDFGIGRMSNECGCAYKTDHEKDNGKISIAFTNSIMKDEERKYLRTLPAHITVEFQLNEDKLNFLLVHGSPRKINEYLFEDREEKYASYYGASRCRHYVFWAHTQPYHRILNLDVDGQNQFRHAINIGSVGKPKDNNPQGGYVMLTINDNSSILDKESIEVEFIRFDCDIERAAKAVEESPLPNDYAESLRKGI